MDVNSKNVSFEAFYDLDSLVLQDSAGATTAYAPISAASITSVKRASGENARVYVGKPVTFTVSGTVKGGNPASTKAVFKVNSDDFAFIDSSGVAYDGTNKTVTVNPITVNGDLWTADIKAVPKKLNSGGTASITIDSATIMDATAETNKAEISKSTTCAPTLWILNTDVIVSDNTNWVATRTRKDSQGTAGTPDSINMDEAKPATEIYISDTESKVEVKAPYNESKTEAKLAEFKWTWND